MRYEIGKVYSFVHLRFKVFNQFDVEDMFRFYVPWQDSEISAVTIKQLRCVEHHRVPGEWDDELQYDGFIFVDEDNVRWRNQYPRAAYSQTSNQQDYVVNRDVSGSTWTEHSVNQLHDIQVYLSCAMQEGYRLQKKNETGAASMLEGASLLEHCNDLANRFTRETGKVVKTTIFRNTLVKVSIEDTPESLRKASAVALHSKMYEGTMKELAERLGVSLAEARKLKREGSLHASLHQKELENA